MKLGFLIVPQSSLFSIRVSVGCKTVNSKNYQCILPLILLFSLSFSFSSFPVIAQNNCGDRKYINGYPRAIQRIDAGVFHTIEIRNGTLWGYGYNEFGQLGDGSTINKTNPVQIDCTTSWANASCGFVHTLAVKSDGTLWAWGYNVFGQLGDGSNTNRAIPTQVGNATNWVAIAGGAYHSLALKSNGTLWAWGQNLYGELGDGSTLERNSPIQIGSENNWVSIAAGLGYSLALKSDGTLWAWGQNDYGQLGDGTTINRTTPVQVTLESDWVCVTTSAVHNLALKSDGTLWAWGKNERGQLGNGTFDNLPHENPIQVGNAADWKAISCGTQHSLALKSNGTLWAWGDNGQGELGNGTTIMQTTPTQIGSSNNWVSITCGNDDYSFATKSDGTLWAWGSNLYGNLGDCTTNQHHSPIQTHVSLNGWSKIKGGLYHTLGIKENGTLWAWGINSLGLLGDGTVINRPSPVQIGTDSSWIDISPGFYHSLGLKSDGTLWAWGANTHGELGDGTLINSLNPKQIGIDNDWRSISASGEYSIALKSNGTFWAWGYNNEGQLGVGSTAERHDPEQIGTDTNWICIASSSYHSLALKSNGTLWAWGYNIVGQLGDGTTINQYSPVQIGADNKWIGISVSQLNSFALKSDGTLWSWGNNANGQLGYGGPEQHSPMQIGSDTNWICLSSGTFHSHALKADGTLWAWGAGGLLGDGTNIMHGTPEQIGADNNWIGISAGGQHTVGLKSERNQFCATGLNNFGQLGDGTINNSNVFICNGITLPSAIISAIPSDTICLGTFVTFSVSVSDAGVNSVNYDFRVNGASVQNGLSNTYTTATLINGDVVKCIITITDGTGVCSFTNTASSNLITMVVNPVGNLAASIGGIQICASSLVSAGGSYFFTSNCDLVVKVVPSGAFQVNGNINTCVIIDGSVQTFNAEPYVQRHFDIEPAINPNNSTATITLYFKDQEFVEFNANRAGFPPLPTVAGGGNSDPNVGNLRVTQYHGVPVPPHNTGNPAPGFYSGNGGSGVLITPTSVNYNSTYGYWEVTFPVNGFSGFYVHTNIYFPLPITLNYLNGIRQGGMHMLNWKVTCNAVTGVTMILERSADARNFSGIYSTNADAARCLQPFDYSDAQPLPGMNYYRLKMVDMNGKISYSGIVALLNAARGLEIINIVPNPVTSGSFKLNIASAQGAALELVIVDMQGRVVSRLSIAVIAGYNSITVNVNNLASGTYTISAIMAADKSKVFRFVKK